MQRTSKIPVIDLFAGPGGLGEGFTSFRHGGVQPFRIGLSIEKDAIAHQTLKLRSFFRQFEGDVPDAYYDWLRNSSRPLNDLYADPRWKEQARRAETDAVRIEIARDTAADVDQRISRALAEYRSKNWVLIGGPPCQAYSLVGRSRMRGRDREKFENDPRHTLYKEYLRILAKFEPAVFVFENVKGLLSSEVRGSRIFERILSDLSRPSSVAGLQARSDLEYDIVPLIDGRRRGDGTPFDLEAATRFVVEAEQLGIPQARHRVILVGVRRGLRAARKLRNDGSELVAAGSVISDLPPLRSGLSKEADAPETWQRVVRDALQSAGVSARRFTGITSVRTATLAKLGRGAEFVAGDARPQAHAAWYRDGRLGGFCNHSSRSHIREDIRRYVFAAAFASSRGRSPLLSDFPAALLPNHRNVQAAIAGQMFGDRFRVQVRNQPSTTITSHISKDGHYYIHYDPLQARSLTVREAARLQTFPDNYFFCGPRTSQYHQVGNAVPPLLARQIAAVVYEVLA